jgi:hypothetical protein
MNLVGWILEILALIIFIRVMDTNPTTWKVGLIVAAIAIGIGGHILRARAARR